MAEEVSQQAPPPPVVGVSVTPVLPDKTMEVFVNDKPVQVPLKVCIFDDFS